MSCRAMRKRTVVKARASLSPPRTPDAPLSGPPMEIPQGSPVRRVKTERGWTLVSAHDPVDPESHIYAWIPDHAIMDGPPSDGGFDRELVAVGATTAEQPRTMAAGGAS